MIKVIATAGTRITVFILTGNNFAIEQYYADYNALPQDGIGYNFNDTLGKI